MKTFTEPMPMRNQKLRELIDSQFNGNVSEFAKTIGKSQQVINRLFSIDKRSGKYPTISNEIEKAILAKVDVREDYFDFKIPSPEVEIKTPAYNSDKIAESLNPSREPINNKGVPYYNFNFQLGFDLRALDNRTNADAIFDIEPYNSCTLWCNATGDSMRPTISSGDMVALKRIDDWSYVINDEIYAIITSNELRTIKRVRDKGDTLLLIPDNPKYSKQEIPKSEVLHIFLVKGAIKPF